jgi:uncharacterized protein YbjT (DUF2867 family)
MSPVDQQDIVKVACAPVTSKGYEGNTFEMTGPEALSMDEIAARISDAIGNRIVYVSISTAESMNDARFNLDLDTSEWQHDRHV